MAVLPGLEERDNHAICEQVLPVLAADDPSVRGNRQSAVALVNAPVIGIPELDRVASERLVAIRRSRRLARLSLSTAALLRPPFRRRRHRLQVALDLTKLRGVGFIVRRKTSEIVDFLEDALHAVLGIGMVAEPLRRAPAFAFRFDLLEKLRHRARIVVVIVEDLRSYKIRLALGLSRVPQKDRIYSDTSGKLRDDTAQTVAADNPSKCRQGQLPGVGFGRLVGPVAQGDVTYLVTHDTRKLRFVVGRFDGTPVDIEEPPGESEGVDGRVVDSFELIGVALSRRPVSQTTAQAVEVTVDSSVIQQRQLALRFLRGLAAQLDVLLRRKEVPPRLQFRALGISQGREQQ